MTKKRPPVGLEDFAKLIRDGFYYVDKTYVVKELLEKWSDVNLFTRPRRFGKTLLMDMLKCFFEIDGPKDVFDGLIISKETELCEQHQGKYPVIFVSLKSVNGLTFEEARAEMVKVLSKEASRHPVLRTSDKLNEDEKDKFLQLCRMEMNAKAADIDLLTGCINTLSEFLYKHYDQKVILLIDEYDVPLAKAEQSGFYEEMVSLVRGLFDQGLKTNPYMKFAVLTGCLRIAKESIFTGMNKVIVYTALDKNFSDACGYTDEEVRAMLEHLDLSQHYNDIKTWYDGYQFGDKHIYCPWDVSKYCDDLYTKAVTKPKSYWMNTSGNEIIDKLLSKAESPSIKDDIEKLAMGESVRKQVKQELTYKDLYTTIDNIWSVLFTTGYLTIQGDPEAEELELTIPNRSIRQVFNLKIYEQVKEKIGQDTGKLKAFCELFPQGKAEEIEKEFTQFLRKNISVRDSGSEKFYHGYLLGMLVNMDTWLVRSNVETGDGYCDISVVMIDDGIGIIIEMKYAAREELAKYAALALEQIDEKRYADHFADYDVTKVLKYGIACSGKSCKVILGE